MNATLTRKVTSASKTTLFIVVIIPQRTNKQNIRTRTGRQGTNERAE
jgi:hypothetical protein